MRILSAHDIVGGKVVELVAAKSVDHARRNPERAQHNGHGGSEILAVSLLALKKKICDGILHMHARQLQGIAEARPEIVLDDGCLVEIGARRTGDLSRELGNSGIESG